MASCSFLHLVIILYLVEHFSEVVCDSASEHFGIGSDAEIQSYATTFSPVTHMEPDKYVLGSILLSDSASLTSVRNGVASLIVGAHGAPREYKEGVGEAARFGSLTGFYQLNATLTIVVDYFYHCLRLVDRHTNQTSRYAGTCISEDNGGNGYIEGTNPRFFFPHSIIPDAKNPNSLLITDASNHAIRMLNWQTSVTSTLYHNRVSELTFPMGMAQDSATGDLFITSYRRVARLDYIRRSVTVLSGSLDSSFSDGSFANSQFNDAREILLINNKTQLLVADRNNNRLRVLDLISETVSSVCSGAVGYTNGKVDSCKLSKPQSLMVLNNTLYVGEQRMVRAIQGKEDRDKDRQTSVGKMSTSEASQTDVTRPRTTMTSESSPASSTDTTQAQEHSTTTITMPGSEQHTIIYIVVTVIAVIICGLLLVICCLWKHKNRAKDEFAANSNNRQDNQMENDTEDPYGTVTEDHYYSVISDPQSQHITATYLSPRGKPTHSRETPIDKPTDPDSSGRYSQVLPDPKHSLETDQRHPKIPPLPYDYAHTTNIYLPLQHKYHTGYYVDNVHGVGLEDWKSPPDSSSDPGRLGYVEKPYYVRQVDATSVVPTDVVEGEYLQPVE